MALAVPKIAFAGASSKHPEAPKEVQKSSKSYNKQLKKQQKQYAKAQKKQAKQFKKQHPTTRSVT